MTVPLERHVSSSAIQQISSPRNMCRQFSTTMPSPSCTLPFLSIPRSHQCAHAPMQHKPTPPIRFPSLIWTLADKRKPPSGSVMSPIRSACSILQDKKITTVYVRYHTLRPTSSLSASALHRPPRSKTCPRNGLPKSTITAPACPSLSSERRRICAPTRN